MQIVEKTNEKKIEYLVFGNVMLDTVRSADGKESGRENIGGPATFAYSGIRLWTDAVMQSSRLGEDYHGLFDPWIRKNEVITDGFEVVTEHCNHSYLIYHPDGTYSGDTSVERFRSDWIQDFGYMKSSPEQIEKWTKGREDKGIYVAQNVDRVWWRQLKEIKARDGFKVMWEIEGPSSWQKFLPEVRNALESVDIFSINVQEARNLFGVETEEECIRELQKLPVDLTLFRVGKKGLYSVTPEHAYLIRSAPVDREIDATGCGNTSTGSALYAYCEGKDAIMTGIMANVASAQNIRQYGVIPDFAAVREFAYQQAENLYEQYRKEEIG